MLDPIFMRLALPILIVALTLDLVGCECGSSHTAREDDPESIEDVAPVQPEGTDAPLQAEAASDEGAEAHSASGDAQARPMPKTREEKLVAMEEARAAFECFSKIDQVALKQIAKESQETQLQLAELCRAGKREEAMATLQVFQARTSTNKNVEAMGQCGEALQNSLPHRLSAMIEIPPLEGSEHICDRY